MLSIKHSTTALFLITASLPKVIVIFALNVTAVHAIDKKNYRHEPIAPIPQKIVVDEKKVKLGKRLFFNPRLSKNNTIACASCHQLDQGGDDNVAMGLSISAERHVFNTPTIFNARYNFRQNWDGTAKSLGEQIDFAIINHNTFNSKWDDVVHKLKLDKSIKKNFNKIYKGGVTKSNIIDAIVEFEKTLITPNSRFDRYLRYDNTSMSQDEIDGYKIFKELGCVSCHQGINIGGNLYQKFGIFYDYIAERGEITKQDYGRMNNTTRQQDAFVFKVPSLRNIAVTAPYLHDGSAETLEDVISIMGKTQLGRTLTDKQIFLIKAFFDTLTGEYKNVLLGAES